MSLVQCPECGRDNVSDFADACPSCGFGIKEYYNKARKSLEEEEKKKQKYNNLIDSVKMPDKPYMPQKPNLRKLTIYNYLFFVIGIIGICLFFAAFKITALDDYFILILFIGAGGIGSSIWISMEINEQNKKYASEKSKYYADLNDYNDAQKDFEAYRKNKVEQKLKQDREMQEWIDRMDKWQAYKDSQSLKCPKCGSSNVGTGARGYNIVTGFVGSNKTVNRCGKCGYMWRPKG